LSFASIFQDQLIYDGLEASEYFRPLDLQGWSTSSTIYHDYLAEVDAVTVIEVGVWKGLSASHIASWLKKRSSGILIAVDTWLGAPEFWGADQLSGKDPSRNLTLVHGYPSVYYQFLSNVVHQNLSDIVVPLPLPSELASSVLLKHNIIADFVHTDAAHEYSSVWADIKLWWKFVARGGILMGDDYSTKYWPGVVQATNEFAELCKLELIVDSRGNPEKWVVKKPDKLPPGLNVLCYE